MSFRQVFWAQAAISLICGICRTSFQSAIDPGQLAAGLIQYPPQDLYAQYLHRGVNAMTVMAAAILKLGFDELHAAVFFSALGSLTYTLAFTSIIFAISGSRLVALVIPHFIMSTGFGLIGLNYEIVLPPGQVTFAPLTLALAAFAIGLWMLGKKSATTVVLALVPFFHPLIGIYIGVAFAAACILVEKNLTRAPVVLLSSILSALALKWLAGTSGAGGANLSELILTNLSKHRVPLGFNAELKFVAAYLAGFVFLVIWKKRTVTFAAVGLFLSLMLFFAVSLSSVYTTSVTSLSSFGHTLYASIPSRNANLISLVLVPVAFGFASVSTLSRYLLLAAIVPAWLLSVYGLWQAEGSTPLEGPLFSPAYFLEPHFAVVVLALLAGTITLNFQLQRIRAVEGAFVLFTAFLVTVSCYVFAKDFRQRNSYWGNDLSMALVSTGKGYLVAAGIADITRQFPQARTRRALLFDTQMPSTLAYLSGDPQPIVERTKDVFGLDLSSPSRIGKVNHRCDDLACEEIRGLFAARSASQWRDLGAKYAFKQVMVPKDWTVQLPLENESQKWRVYRVD